MNVLDTFLGVSHHRNMTGQLETHCCLFVTLVNLCLLFLQVRSVAFSTPQGAHIAVGMADGSLSIYGRDRNAIASHHHCKARH